jgi:hypothetical protein
MDQGVPCAADATVAMWFGGRPAKIFGSKLAKNATFTGMRYVRLVVEHLEND